MGRMNVASENSFQLIFPKLPYEDSIDREFVLHIYETIMPGVSFNKSEVHWQGYVMPNISDNLQYDEWNVQFDIDENFNNWKRIYKWMSNINNNKDIAGQSLNDYSVDADLLVYDNYERTVIKSLFRGIMPVSLGAITFSSREGENYLTSEVTFAYIYFEMRE